MRIGLKTFVEYLETLKFDYIHSQSFSIFLRKRKILSIDSESNLSLYSRFEIVDNLLNP
ncbi:hypothetical protein NARC_160085 [Candidatus Nitrosocosmicus arcticus]|uniref:Uncharacterized protein n=1 Tax=Candidatus Nitrosocosmicus arcticus TaxID=2035267 RepID=A0A557SRZ2_9ARCH|nr:hypothetical protein NARC_160085 [Candidatus Nitrosocosmicus arcticus]